MTAANKKKQEKKPFSPIAVIVIVVMFAVFCAQMIFPTNLGAVYDEKAENAVSVNVTVTSGKEETELKAYNTDVPENIVAFGKWAGEKKMRNRSLADGLSADSKTMTKYNFQVKLADGSYEAIVIDEKGFVHVDAQLFKLTEDPETFLKEMEGILETWSGNTESNA